MERKSKNKKFYTRSLFRIRLHSHIKWNLSSKCNMFLKHDPIWRIELIKCLNMNFWYNKVIAEEVILHHFTISY